MACTVIYPNPLKPKPGRPPWHLVKGQLDGKPCRWHVTIWYDVPQECLEVDKILGIEQKNPIKLVLKSEQPRWLHDLIGQVIDPELDRERAAIREVVPGGGISNVKWQAVQER